MPNDNPVNVEKKMATDTQKDVVVAVTITTVPAGPVVQTTAATNPVTPTVVTPVATPELKSAVKERSFGRTCG